LANEWHYLVGEQQVGPVSQQQVLDALQRGEITGQAYVWTEGMADWMPLASVPALQSGQPGMPPIAPVPTAMPPGYAARPPKPDSHLVGAILATIFCCLPFGIAGLIYAAQVDSKYNAGDYQGAAAASDNANRWMWVAIIFGTVGIIGSIALIA
jgi:hypothetical protein